MRHQRLSLTAALLAFGFAAWLVPAGPANAQFKKFTQPPPPNPIVNPGAFKPPVINPSPAVGAGSTPFQGNQNPTVGNPFPSFNPGFNGGINYPYGVPTNYPTFPGAGFPGAYNVNPYLDYFVYGNAARTYNNPYWYMSPVVSQYGYYGNPWSPFPYSPLYGYQFAPWMQNGYGNLNPMSLYPPNPFIQQGPFNASGAAQGLQDPANIFNK